MTQEVSSNPNTNIVQYHVTELNQETWTVNDYNFVSIILKTWNNIVLKIRNKIIVFCSNVKSRSNRRSSAKGDYLTSSYFGRRAFAIVGPSEWNKLPVSLRHAPSIGSFKTKLKTQLFQIYYG